MNEVEVAQRFYRYGMVLKQHANFYNNISTEMVPCQKPMMLKDAIDFEKVCLLQGTAALQCFSSLESYPKTG